MAMAHAGQVLCSQATTDLAPTTPCRPWLSSSWAAYKLRGLERPEVVFQFTHADLPTDFPRLRAADGGGGNLPRS